VLGQVALESLMKFRSLMGRAAIVVVLALLSIEVHELGHYAVYALAGHPAHMSFQRVSPVKPVSESLIHMGLLGGPALSFLAAMVFLLAARRWPSFALVTASFTNASLRVFPCLMDLIRALNSGHPFSDEGELTLAFTINGISRIIVMVLVLGLWLGLSALVAREYDFRTKKWPKVLAIYLLSLAVGIATVIVDELLGLNV
jgi:hypothetical protein